MSEVTNADIQHADRLVTPHVLNLCLATATRSEGSIREIKAMLVRAVAEAIAASRSALQKETGDQ